MALIKKPLLALLAFIITATVYSQAPVVSSFSPLSGNANSTVVITGSNFSAAAANNIVYFGDVRATVVSSTTSQLNVLVPAAATYSPVYVTVNNLTGSSANRFAVTFPGNGTLTARSFSQHTDYSYLPGQVKNNVLGHGDFDGDGKIDLAIVKPESNAVAVCKNSNTESAISFSQWTDIGNIYNTDIESMVTGDVDGDGKIDIIVSGSNDSFYVFRNTGTAGNMSFAPARVFNSGALLLFSDLKNLQLADLDGDGKKDLIAVNFIYAAISVFKNNSTPGTISFSTKNDINTVSGPESVTIGDIDGDNKPEMMVSYMPTDNRPYFSIFRNNSSNGNLSFASAMDYTGVTLPGYTAIGDIDGDGKPDIAVESFGSGVAILKNSSSPGNITLTNIYTAPLPSSSSITKRVVLADLTGDGKADIVTGSWNSNNKIAVLKNTSSAGTVSFEPFKEYSTFTYSPQPVVADITGNGKPDILIYDDENVAAAKDFAFSVLQNKINNPEINSFTPTAGNTGTVISIKGLNFTNATAVSFGNSPASSFTVVSDTLITATVGIATPGKIAVTTASGTDSVDGFRTPFIRTTTLPSGGPGTVVVLRGFNFTGVTAVAFGGTAVQSFDVTSDSTIRVTIGTGSIGDITVTSPLGTGVYKGFNFIPPAPIVESFSPAEAAGGATVTIRGKYFFRATAVSFGSSAASSFTIVSDTVMTAVVSASGSTGSVSVRTPAGTGSLGGFTFIVAPTITAFTPATANAGDTVTITGTQFSAVTNVSFGGTPAASFTTLSLTSIKAVVGNGTPGAVSVTAAGGTGSRAGFKMYPVVENFLPSSAGAGATVSIKGKYFTAATAVSFGGTPAASFVTVSDTLINAVPGPGSSGDVSVTTAAGTRFKPGFIFTSPVITSFSPVVGGSGMPVTITGLNFTGVTAVSFGGVAAGSFTVLSDTVITATVAAGAGGSISMTNASGSGSKTGFSFSALPLIGSITPQAAAAGSVLVIKGAGFNTSPAANAVYFGPAKAAVLSATANTLNVIVPAGATYEPVTVTANGFTSYSSQPFLITFPSSNLTPNSLVLTNTYTTDSVPTSIALGDFDMDGKTDLAVRINDSIGILKNSSTVGKIEMQSFSYFKISSRKTIFNPKDRLLTGDFDGDGKLDIISIADSGVSIVRNTSTAANISFAPEVYIKAGTRVTDIAVTDFNTDGKPDIAMIMGYTITTIKNQSVAGSIAFGQPVQINTSDFYHRFNTGITVADFDGDGKPDIAAADNYLAGQNDYGYYAGYVYKNISTTDSIFFAKGVNLGKAGIHPQICTGDFDGDGKLDVIIPNEVFYDPGGGTTGYVQHTATVFRNTCSNRNFSFAQDVDLTFPTYTITMPTGSLTGDNKPDMTVLGLAYASIYGQYFYDNTGNPGQFTFNSFSISNPNEPTCALIGDLDGDGKPDEIIADRGNSIRIYQNKIGEPLPVQLCIPVASTSITADITGTKWQWQASTDSMNFINLVDNANYSGTAAAVLQLNNIPSFYAGYRFRCLVDGIKSSTFVIDFANDWTGAVSSAWEDSANWSCNKVPDINTHVVVDSGAVVLNSNTVCKTVSVSNHASLTVSSGHNLVISSGELSVITLGATGENITQNAAACGALVQQGNRTVIRKGIVWGTATMPSLTNAAATNAGAGNGGFTSVLNNLSAGTPYHIRAYAVTNIDTVYGNDVLVTTAFAPATDIDGNTYPTVTICNQVWTSKNLEVTRYRNGDNIPQVQDAATWASLTTGAWCYYASNTANGIVYGKLYNWYAVNDPRGLAPAGWHVPSENEWMFLGDTCLGGLSVAGGKVKTITVWTGSNTGATNSSGFNGLPAGYCSAAGGVFGGLGTNASWWTSTSIDDSFARCRNIFSSSAAMSATFNSKKGGFSIRCVKD